MGYSKTVQYPLSHTNLSALATCADSPGPPVGEILLPPRWPIIIFCSEIIWTTIDLRSFRSTPYHLANTEKFFRRVAGNPFIAIKLRCDRQLESLDGQRS
jgi:hypothetical protein